MTSQERARGRHSKQKNAGAKSSRQKWARHVLNGKDFRWHGTETQHTLAEAKLEPTGSFCGSKRIWLQKQGSVSLWWIHSWIVLSGGGLKCSHYQIRLPPPFQPKPWDSTELAKCRSCVRHVSVPKLITGCRGGIC